MHRILGIFVIHKLLYSHECNFMRIIYYMNEKLVFNKMQLYLKDGKCIENDNSYQFL